MEPIILQNTCPEGISLQAIFDPERGMNLLSYKKGSIEVIDQTTKEEFDNRFAGLGPLIGPHFHHQSPEYITTDYDSSLFPHIKRVRKQGTKDPFSHGIARYVPWNPTVEGKKIHAKLTDKDTWNGVPLGKLEGCKFEMEMTVELTRTGLVYELKVESERNCLIGLHYYYKVEDDQGLITSFVQNEFNDMGKWKPMPEMWCGQEKDLMIFDLKEEADYGFRPKSNSAQILYETGSYTLDIRYQSKSDEHSWQLYHPQDASFVCIEPLSAKNPRNLSAKKSGIQVHIEIIS